MSDELARLDATAQAERIRSGDVSPLEAVEAAIQRIEKLNPQLNAVIHPLFEQARERAESDALPDGPFRGVPFLLKDMDGYSKGDPWHAGMRLLRKLDYVADHDSYHFEKLRAAGLIVVGKTNCPELGMTITTEPEAYGPTRNPWDLDRSPGGSSGGSAAAVAAGLVAAAHAGDGGGSIRVPASECGLVGLKPSRGRISLGPDLGAQWHGLVCVHALCRSVRDSAALLDVGAGPMPGDPYWAPSPARPFAEEVGADPGRLRVGLLPKRLDGEPLHADCRAAVERAGRLLESLGHHVEIAHPAALEEVEAFRRGFTGMVGCWTAASLAGISALVGKEIGEQDVEAGTWRLATIGHDYRASDYIELGLWLEAYARRMASWWASGFDLLVTPTIALPPPPLGYLAPDPEHPEAAVERILSLMSFTPQFNATGQPAISLPLHRNGEGLPIGVQVVAAYAREDQLFQVAAQLEQAVQWTEHRPTLCF
jgi:amidase